MNRKKTSAPRSSDHRRRLAALTALIMAPGLSATASAQVKTRAGPVDGDGTGKAAVDLPEMLVEGQANDALSSPKYTEPLLDTPQTVAVIPRAVFEEQGATTLRDVLRNTPGITFQAGEGGTPAGDQMTIRGFSARTDMFIDGVRDLGGYTRDTFNLEQVEVAKGPSSSTAGRGSTGGSINMVSKTPHSERFRSLAAGVGTDGYKRTTIDFNQPVGSDHTAARLNAMWQSTGVAGRDEVKNKSWGVAPSLAFGLGTPTRVTISYLHLSQDNVPDYGLPWDAFQADPPVDQSNYYGLLKRDYEKISNDLATVQAAHDFDRGLTLRNLTRYGRTRRDSVITAPRFVSGSDEMIRRTDMKSRDQTDAILTNQTNVTAKFGAGEIRHTVTGGLEVSRETERDYARADTDPAPPDTDLYHPDPNDSYHGAVVRTGAYTDSVAKSAAVYAFDTVKFGSRWELSGGLRWDYFDTNYQSIDADGTVTPYGRTDRMVSGKAGLVFKPRPNGNVYAAYGTSFNPSAEGLSLASRRQDLSDVPPEKSCNYELGTKWEVAGGRLSLSAALFRTEKTNARTPGVDPNDPPQVLEGEQRVQGVELGASGRLTTRWNVFAGGAFMDSDIVKSNTDSEEGENLTLTPKKSFNFWTTYALPGGLVVGGGAQYMDAVFRNTTNTTSVPSYWLFNAAAIYAVNRDLSLRLNLNNLANKAYVDRVGGGHYIPGPTRSGVLSAQYKF